MKKIRKLVFGMIFVLLTLIVCVYAYALFNRLPLDEQRKNITIYDVNGDIIYESILRPFSEGDGACGNQLDVVKRVFVCLDTHIDFMVGYAYLVLAEAVVNPQCLIGYSPDDVLQMGQLSDVSLQQYPIVAQPLSGE